MFGLLKFGQCKYCAEKISSKATICPYCGKLDPYSPTSLESKDEPKEDNKSGTLLSLSEVRELAKNGRKIEAIKLYREMTDCGLKEAKDYVDSLS